MKKKKAPKVVYMHQHRSIGGEIFGISHPDNAVHKKASTIEAHNRTVSKAYYVPAEIVVKSL